MALTPANILDEMILEAAQRPMQMAAPPPRQYMTPGMRQFEMGIDGLPMPKGQPQESNPILPPPRQPKRLR